MAKVGYTPNFIAGLSVPIPKRNQNQIKDTVIFEGSRTGEFTYPHFSIFLSKSRKFAILTATNIKGSKFQKSKRSKTWKKDDRGKEFQLGTELYTAKKSDFDKGHLTKREDPQWGTEKEAQLAANATFHFTNSVPQLKELNQRTWKRLEDYILKTECVPDKMTINVFTGPVLKEDDPIFVTPVKGEEIQLPTLFWKVVFFSNNGKTLSKVGFLMGQEKLLHKRKLVKPVRTNLMFASHLTSMKEHFMNFKEAETYQVTTTTIEKLTKLKFPKAFEPYKDKRPIKLIIKNVDIKGITIRGDEIAYKYFGLITS